MKPNMGTIDRIVRIAAAVLVAVLYFQGIISGTLAIILLVVAGIFIATSLVSFCPLYTLIGLSTRPKEEQSNAPTQPK